MKSEVDAPSAPLADAPPPPPSVRRMPDGSIRVTQVEEYDIPVECLPDLNKLVIEDDTPLDNIFAEKQQRLLTDPLYNSWLPSEGRTFLALANVGLFYKNNTPGMAPDVMLSMDVRLGEDLSIRENRSYYIWEMGKAPDVVIEFVSDRRGGEESDKFIKYARIGVPYYVIFDPEGRLGQGVLRAFALNTRRYHPAPFDWFEAVELGLTLWQGSYEGHPWRWLRWCGRSGEVILTGYERAEQERQRAEQERQRAEQERQRAEQERQRAEQERQRAERLVAQLRAAGIEPAP